MRRAGAVRRAAVVAAVAVFALMLRVPVPVPVLAAGTIVHITGTLDPSAVVVGPGTTVTWRNDDQDRHRIRSTSGPTEFDSGDLDPGQSYSVTFSSLGTWQYLDDRNKDLSNYWGTVTVATAPTPAPSRPPGATDPPVTTTPPPPPGDIGMAGRAFSPANLTVDAGTAVRWRNNDGREHTVSARDGGFDSGIMRVGATFTRVFSTPGTFAYLCQIHPDMTGTITVRSAPGATPPPQPGPTPTPKPTPAPTSPPAGGSDVHLVDFAFDPKTLDIVAGTTVTWLNTGAALHTVTAADGSFDSGLLAAGTGRFSRRFATPGTYSYLCSLHPSMTATIRVSGPGGASPPPAPAPTPKPTAPPVAAGQPELRDFAFAPSAIRITPGTTITWINTGVAPHTVTDRAGAFDSGILNRGDTYSHTFATPGTFQLLCSIHPDMHATVTVAAPGATAPPPATPAPVATPPPGSGEVAIIDFDYAPGSLAVSVGTTVKWTNTGVAPHTVTAKDGSFDSGFLNKGEAFSHTFATEGVFEYICSIHPAMVGTVVVGAGVAGGPVGVPAGSAGPPADPSTGPSPSAGPSSSAVAEAVPGASGNPGASAPAGSTGQAPSNGPGLVAAGFGAVAGGHADQAQLGVIAALCFVAVFVFLVLLSVLAGVVERE